MTSTLPSIQDISFCIFYSEIVLSGERWLCYFACRIIQLLLPIIGEQESFDIWYFLYICYLNTLQVQSHLENIQISVTSQVLQVRDSILMHSFPRLHQEFQTSTVKSPSQRTHIHHNFRIYRQKPTTHMINICETLYVISVKLQVITP
jgi:hypothetical protein